MTKTGIISYGAYIPKYRLQTTDIAEVWGKDAKEIVSSLGIAQKAVAAVDEDAVTLAMEAASRALRIVDQQPEEIETVLVGSESHPYAVNPSSTIVAEFLGVGHEYLAADLEFACKAGSAGMQAIAGLIDSSHQQLGLSIGSDTAQSKPHDALEYTSAAAAAAFLLGDKTTYQSVANLMGFTSYSSDTPDFWRRDGIRYPSHAGRFTGEPAYFTHVTGAANLLMRQLSITPKDCTYCVFHMPNGKFPRDVAKRLGFTVDQLAPSLTVDLMGNPYSASSLLGFAAVLDQAKPGDTIFMVSYGSGAGSDAFYWQVTDAITTFHDKQHGQDKVHDQLQDTKQISYVQYLKQTHKI